MKKIGVYNKSLNGLRGDKKLFKALSRICLCRAGESLKNYCTIKIGGRAKFVCLPKNVKQVRRLIAFLNSKKIKYYVIGNGSNIVFNDDGFSGVIICLKKLNKVSVCKKGFGRVIALGGANLFAIHLLCARLGFGGFEFAYGIPASVGGALCMNAGAFGGEMANVVSRAWVLCGKKIRVFNVSKMGLDYRHSNFLNKKDIILKVEFKFFKQSSSKIKQLQQEYFNKRILSQPHGMPSAGSVFKRAGEGAGKIIDKMGLKGVTIGDIQISPKHANFFVNLGNATSKDLSLAISLAKKQAYEREGVCLQEEIIFVGD